MTQPSVDCLIVWFVLSIAASGCGSPGPQTYPVSGSVTLDGTPLDEGQIIFRSVHGNEKSWAGRISQGHFEFPSTPGKKRVEITAIQATSTGLPAASGEPALQAHALVPAKYNTQSELTAEVRAQGQNRFDFQLSRQIRQAFQ